MKSINVEVVTVEIKVEIISELEIHLKTCEIYQYGSCYSRDKSLSEMKKHVQDTHTPSTGIGYLKMDRNNECEVSQTYYSLSEL